MTLLRSLICFLLVVSGNALFGLSNAPKIVLTAKQASVQQSYDIVDMLCYGAGFVWILLAGWVGVLVWKELRKQS